MFMELCQKCLKKSLKIILKYTKTLVENPSQRTAVEKLILLTRRPRRSNVQLNVILYFNKYLIIISKLHCVTFSSFKNRYSVKPYIRLVGRGKNFRNYAFKTETALVMAPSPPLAIACAPRHNRPNRILFLAYT